MGGKKGGKDREKGDQTRSRVLTSPIYRLRTKQCDRNGEGEMDVGSFIKVVL